MDKKSNMIKEDLIVSKVVGDPEAQPEALMIFGFTGKSNEEGHIRLYLNPQLDDFVDIPVDDIYNTMEVPAPLSFFGGSLLWINKNSQLLHRDKDNRVFKAPFTEGRETNGKSPATYADVLKNMYASPTEAVPNSENTTPVPAPAAVDAQNQSANPVNPVQYQTYQTPAPVQNGQDHTYQQPGQTPGIPPFAFSLIAPQVSPTGLVKHSGVMQPQPQNTWGGYNRNAHNQSGQNMQDWWSGFQAARQETNTIGNSVSPAAVSQGQQNQSQAKIPPVDSWPAVPENIKTVEMTKDQQTMLNMTKGSIIN